MTRQTPTTLLLGASQPFAAEIAARLRADGANLALSSAAEADVTDALSQISTLGSLVIVMPAPSMGTALLDITDPQINESFQHFLDLYGALHLAIPKLQDGGVILLVNSRGHLGSWNGAHEMAFAGGAAGLMRSVTLETMARGVRANTIAVEVPGAGPPSDPDHVADLAAYLLSPAAAAVNGELILANGGGSLQMNEARDRRTSRASSAS